MNTSAKEHLIVRDGLTREELTEERIESLRQEFASTGFDLFLDKETREASRRDALTELPNGDDLWVFAYGSLMWNPAIHHGGMTNGRIYGYHRRFCLHMPLGRGTPERPGLMLGLDVGGSCRGKAIRIPADLVESESTILWRREMISGSYRPTWLPVQTDDGPVRAVTFVVNPEHPRYLGDVTPEDTVKMIATAEGILGRCRDYLSNTVVHLDELGIGSGPMHHLLAEVEAYAGKEVEMEVGQ